MKNHFCIYLLCLLMLHGQFAFAQIQSDRDLQINKIASAGGIPWGMAQLSDNELLITLREGKLLRLDLKTGQINQISGLADDIKVTGQGGLFDIKLSPDFATTGWIFFSYNKDVGQKGATTLARAKLDKNRLTAWQDLLVTESITNKNIHYGGRISFDQKGHLFLSVGERGHRPNAQDLSNHAGKILRLNLDGSIPQDNPFTDNPDARAEIWSYGHRNPQGLFYDPENGLLWESEHGPRGGDEINLIKAGNNYGWPEVSYGTEYWAPIPIGKATHQEGMQQPVHKYVPSIAPGSLIVYQSDLFKGWHGNLLSTALALQHLNRIVLSQDNKVITEQRLLDSLGMRLRNVIEGTQGSLFITTDNGDIYRITPKVSNQ